MHTGPVWRRPLATVRFGARRYCEGCAREMAWTLIPVVARQLAARLRLFHELIEFVLGRID